MEHNGKGAPEEGAPGGGASGEERHEWRKGIQKGGSSEEREHYTILAERPVPWTGKAKDREMVYGQQRCRIMKY